MTTATFVGRVESRPTSARHQVETLDDFARFLRLEPIWTEPLEQALALGSLLDRRTFEERAA